MKKSLSAFILFTIFTSAFLFAQENETAPIDTPEIFLNAEYGIKSFINYNDVDLLGNIGCTADLNRWEFTALLCAEENMLDYSTSVLFLPLVTNTIDLGIHTLFHGELEFNTYLDLDMLLGLYFSAQAGSHFIFTSSFYYFRKSSLIFQISKNTPFLNSNTMAVELDFKCPLTPESAVGFTISSFNKTKYNSFITPFYTLYSSYDITDKITVNLALQINYIDMFTLSGNINHITVSSGIDWRLK